MMTDPRGKDFAPGLKEMTPPFIILKLPRRGRLWISLGAIALALFLLALLFTQEVLNPRASQARAQARPQPEEDIQQPPAPVPPPAATSLLKKSTVFTVYGRAFGRAPILGRLGTYKDLDMMAADLPKWAEPIKKYNDGKSVVPGIHLIYAMAAPCQERPDCLNYVEGAVHSLVDDYIKPAAARGWVVILDTQLGRSNPAAQVNRMIEKGYLKYDNVHVAIDPEFHLYPDKTNPGVPIGTVEASQINEAQKILDDYVKAQGLKTKKVLIVHQFGDEDIHDGVPFMIEHKKELKTFENVELVVDMDGLGTPQLKIWKYNRIADPSIYPFLEYRGIKVFYPNQWEKAGHYDRPPMTIEQLFGVVPAFGRLRAIAKPDVVIIA
jgi:hypothetical protein